LDGNNGGELFVLPCDTSDGEAGLVGATTDIHCTVMCFSSPTGEPVMAAVIEKLSKNITEVPMHWKLGNDITKQPEEGTTEFNIFDNSFGPNKVVPGGPRNTFNGKELPCFVGCSSNASITSELLAKMFQTIDKAENFGSVDR
jgi:hypothetical protein